MGIVFLKQPGTLMAVIGWLLTMLVAVMFFNTSPAVALYASVSGVLASFGISLMVLFTILQVTMMDLTGAIRSISEYIKSIAAERYEQIMILNVGFGSFLVSIGATPVTMLPPIMMALGFSPVASVALPCLGYDPLTSFSLLAVPITLPAAVFGFDAVIMCSNVALFLPVISTGLSLGMLWVADGMDGMRKGFVPAVLAGLSLGIFAIVFVNILPASAIGLVGVFAGLVTIAVLFLHRAVRGKPILAPRKTADNVTIVRDPALMPLWKAALPWVLLVVLVVFISIPQMQSGLYSILGDAQKITVVANKAVDLKLMNQAYFWVVVSTLIAAPFLISSRAEGLNITKIWIKRAWSPTLAAAIFFAIAYVMDWSGQTVVNNTLTFVSGSYDLNMNAVIGYTLALAFGIAFPIVSPLLGLFGSFVSGSETSSNVMFYGILQKATSVLNLDFTSVYAAHMVAGGIASGIAPAKIINAAAVIDQPGIEGEVIRKSAVVVIALAFVTSALLILMLFL
ncbi:MAG: L-lactate permease [Methanoregulaceae archaeon]|nr:L-lactate permease [Methanoregulaceae archaeon]